MTVSFAERSLGRYERLLTANATRQFSEAIRMQQGGISAVPR